MISPAAGAETDVMNQTTRVKFGGVEMRNGRNNEQTEHLITPIVDK